MISLSLWGAFSTATASARPSRMRVNRPPVNLAVMPSLVALRILTNVLTPKVLDAVTQSVSGSQQKGQMSSQSRALSGV